MTVEEKLSRYGLSVRRLLTVIQLLQYCSDDVKESMFTPPWLSNDLNNLTNCTKRTITSMRLRGDEKFRSTIKEDMEKDQLFDISLLIDTVQDIDNIGEITEALAEIKKTAEIKRMEMA